MDDLRKALFRALEKSDVNMLRAVLARRVSLACEDGDPCPVCLEAVNCDRNDLDILDMLLAAGADPAQCDRRDGAGALHWVTARSRPDVMEWFLARGLDVNAVTMDGTTPLMRTVVLADASGIGSAALRDIGRLLDAGADVGLADHNGQTALHMAARQGMIEIVKLLLDQGAAVDVRDGGGATPLLLAAEQGQVATVRLLLDRGADPNAQAAGGFGVLHDIAALAPEVMTEARVTLADMLIAAGADLELADDHGKTALCWAASYNNTAIAERLLRNGADTGVQAGYALREAVFYGHSDVVDALLGAGADAGLSGEAEGEAALLVAANEGYVHGLNALLDHGADAEINNIDGETALLIAVRCGHGDAAEALLEHGANARHSDFYGNTALWWAQRRQDARLIALLS